MITFIQSRIISLSLIIGFTIFAVTTIFVLFFLNLLWFQKLRSTSSFLVWPWLQQGKAIRVHQEKMNGAKLVSVVEQQCNECNEWVLNVLFIIHCQSVIAAFSSWIDYYKTTEKQANERKILSILGKGNLYLEEKFDCKYFINTNWVSKSNCVILLISPTLNFFQGPLTTIARLKNWLKGKKCRKMCLSILC